MKIHVHDYDKNILTQISFNQLISLINIKKLTESRKDYYENNNQDPISQDILKLFESSNSVGIIHQNNDCEIYLTD